MGHTQLNAGITVGGHRSSIPRPGFGKRTREQELEAKLLEVQKEYADLHAELFEAAQVYRRLSAPRLVEHGDFAIASETFAARHVPGDFFAVERIGNSTMLVLGDISGKGLAAGMWITFLLGMFGIHRESSLDPEAIVTGMNSDLCRASIAVPLASLFLGRLDSQTGTLDYCSAGHPPTLLFRKDGSVESLSDGGPLLGVVPDAQFARGSVELRTDDVLVAYSDGILEARNQEDKEFGFDQLETQVRLAQSGSAAEVMFSVLGAVQDFVGGYPQADDISFVVVRRN